MNEPLSVDDVFLHVADLAEADREAFLAQQPDSVAQRVRTLLNAESGVDEREFLKDPMMDSLPLTQDVQALSLNDTQNGSSLLDADDTAVQSSINGITSEPLPKTIGPYEIIQLIGRGGMGRVYLAQQHAPIIRLVAVKVISTIGPTGEALARFSSEQKLLALMDHQNIAKVLDAGVTDKGRAYFAMELVKDGSPITKYCDDHQLDVRQRLTLFVQACRAIQHAHQKGIMHRDIKPSNILIGTYDGEPIVKVIDFGLAKSIDDQHDSAEHVDLTQDGHVVGTFAYMSPEQADYRSKDVDTQSDVYSLGVVLFELLTGSTPITKPRIRSESIDHILRSIREEDAPRPSRRLRDSVDSVNSIVQQRRTDTRQFNSILVGDLDWIALKSLDKDRARRYAGANTLADDIERFLNGEPVEARPPSFRYRAKKTLRKNKVAVSAFAAVALSLILGLITTSFMYRRAKSEANRATTAEGIAVNEKEQKEAGLARTNYLVSVARWEQARAADALRYLQRVPPKYRKFEWDLANRQFSGSDLTCNGHTGKVQSVAFSPDGKHVVSASDDQSVVVWDARSGERLNRLSGHANRVTRVRYSPDGQKLATSDAAGVVLIWKHDEIADPGIAAKLRIEGHRESILDLSFSPDSNRLATVAEQGQILVYDVESQGIAKAIDGSDHQPTCVAFHPNGRHLVTGTKQNKIVVWSLASSRMIETVGEHRKAVTAVRFSPSGNTIASASEDTTICIWHSRPQKGKSPRLVQKLKGHSQGVWELAFSSSGDRLASAGYDRVIRLWDLHSGAAKYEFVGHTDSVYGLAFSPSGNRLASGSFDHSVRIWDATTGNQHREFSGHGSPVSNLLVSQSQQLLVSGSSDGSVRLWHTATGKLRSVLRTKGLLETVALSPDSKWIATGGTDKTIQVWSTELAKQVSRIDGHNSGITSVAFSDDNQLIACGDESGAVNLWQRSDSTRLGSFDGHTDRINDVKVNTQHLLVASCSNDRSVRVWDTKTGAAKHVFQSEKPMRTIDFNSAENIIAAGGNDHSIHLWDLETGEERAVLQGHSYPIRQLSFFQEGTRIASISVDGTAILWDATTGEELRKLKAGNQWQKTAAIGIDGSLLAMSTDENRIAIWNTNLASPEIQNQSAYVDFKSQPSASWLMVQAEMAESKQDWYAATVYWASLANADRKNRLAQFGLAVAHDRLRELDPNSERRLSANIRRLTALWDADISSEDASAIKSYAYKRMLIENHQPSEFLTRSIAKVASKNPAGIYQTVLGAILFRAERIDDAIKVLKRSKTLNQKELGLQSPLPFDVAFLAMSHLKRNEVSIAKNMRRELINSMKTPRFKSDAAAQRIAIEMNRAFADLEN